MKTVIDKYTDLPFVWGKTDCCQFVGECVETIIGHNPAKAFQYESEDEAEREIKRFGELDDLITSLFGKPTYGYEDGYVGLVDTGRQKVAGVFYNDRLLCRVPNNTIVDLPPNRAAKVWCPCPN